jgi:membrane protein
MIYITTPNTKVPFKDASIGAAFTGSVWVIFIFLFIIYVKAFATGTFAIYGALASIPFFY